MLKGSYEIYLVKSSWIHSCPFFMQYSICKYATSFKINIMPQAVPPECNETTLCSRKKQGHLKKVSLTLTIDSTQYATIIHDEDDDSHKDIKVCNVAM